NAWTIACARPLYHWALVLTGLGILLADRSPVTMVLVAVSFLLMVKSLPRVEWLYGTVAALGAACYFEWLAYRTWTGIMGFALAAALGLWASGVLVQRYKPALWTRLGLSPLDYESPLFHSSIVAGLIALGLRVVVSLDQGAAWTAHAWLPMGLSVLALVM